MTTPRPHAELARRYLDDDTLKCWFWDGVVWIELDNPSWGAVNTYHVGHEDPTEPPRKMCEIAGVRFPMPETVALLDGQEYFFPTTGGAQVETWFSSHPDTLGIETGFIHLTREAAEAHSRALLAATKQAMEAAK